MRHSLLRVCLGSSLAAMLFVSVEAQAQPQSDDYHPNVTSSRSRPPQTGDGEEHDALDHVLATQISLGVPNADAMRGLVRAAEKQRGDYPGRFGEGPSDNVPLWRSLGPTSDKRIQLGPLDSTAIDSGRLRKILPHPSDPNILYVLTSGGGLWGTLNFQSATPLWFPLSDQVGTTSGGSVAFGRTPNVLYLGAGDPFDAPGGFMVKSSLFGIQWSSAVFLGSATRVLDVEVDTSQASDIVLAGTDAGLFRSADGGNTYSQVASLGANQVWSLVRTNAGWLASVQAQSPPGITSVAIPSLGASKLFLSVDRGMTWEPSGSGFSVVAGRTTLAVGQSGDATVYAYASTVADSSFNFDQLDLFRSDNGGLTFTPLNINAKAPPIVTPQRHNMDLMTGQAWYNQMILIDPTDATRNTVYLGGQLNSAKTTDGGKTWAFVADWLGQAGLPYVHADYHTAAFTNFGGQKAVLIGNDGGLAISHDGGATWDMSKNQGITSHLLYSITSGVQQPDNILIGLQDDGTRFREQGPTNYNQVLGGDGMGTGWSQANDAVSIATMGGGFIFTCFQNPPADQSRFTEVDGTIIDYGYNFHTSLITPTAKADPTGRTFYHNELTTVWQTQNAGITWQPIGIVDEGFGGNISAGAPFTFLFRDTPFTMSVGPVNRNQIAVGATAGRVALTQDGGNTWSIVGVNQQVPGFFSYVSDTTWATQKDLYVASVQPAPGFIRVAKSTNAGAPGSWTSAQNGLPDMPVQRIIADTTDTTGKILYAGTDLGVYQTLDGGVHWAYLGTGLPQVRVTDLYMPPSGNFLRAATYGRGVWELSLSHEE